MSRVWGAPRRRLTQSPAVLTPRSSTGPSGPGTRPAARRMPSSTAALRRSGARGDRVAGGSGLLDLGEARPEAPQSDDLRADEQDRHDEDGHVGEHLQADGHARLLLALEQRLVVDELAGEARGRGYLADGD